jgi:hypothetical protein
MKKPLATRCRRRSRRGGFSEEDVFVTTKLWNTNHRPERVKPAFDASRKDISGLMFGGAIFFEKAIESLV